MKQHQPLDAEQQRLAAEYWPKAQRIARRYESKYRYANVDFLGPVGLALTMAIPLYREGFGASFSTYISRRLHGACLDVLRTSKAKGYGRRDRKVVRVIPFSAIDGEREDIADGRPRRFEVVDDAPAIGSAIEGRDQLSWRIRGLPVMHRKVVDLLYRDGERPPMRDVYEGIGRTESMTYRYQREAYELLRRDIMGHQPEGGSSVRSETEVDADRRDAGPKYAVIHKHYCKCCKKPIDDAQPKFPVKWGVMHLDCFLFRHAPTVDPFAGRNEKLRRHAEAMPRPTAAEQEAEERRKEAQRAKWREYQAKHQRQSQLHRQPWSTMWAEAEAGKHDAEKLAG